MNRNCKNLKSVISCFYGCILIIIVIFSGCVSEKKQPVDYVNPFIGTQQSGERASTDGRTHPGACVPYGMTKWIPANIDNQSDPYKYVKDSARMRLYTEIIREEIFGFRGSHYPNGSHMRDYGSYDFMPIVGDLKYTAAERASKMSHDREAGEHVKAYVSFNTKGEETIEVKIGTSFIDIETAAANLDKEIGDKKFATIRSEARNEWNEKLSQIEVEGGSEDDKVKFYTSLYLVHFEPRISSSGNRYYSVFDEKIHETAPGSEFYNDFSLWDTYRNKHSLLTILEPRDQISGPGKITPI